MVLLNQKTVLGFLSVSTLLLSCSKPQSEIPITDNWGEFSLQFQKGSEIGFGDFDDLIITLVKPNYVNEGQVNLKYVTYTKPPASIVPVFRNFGETKLTTDNKFEINNFILGNEKWTIKGQKSDSKTVLLNINVVDLTTNSMKSISCYAKQNKIAPTN